VLNKQMLAVEKKWVTFLEVDRRADNSRTIRMSQRDGVWSEFFMLHSVLSFGVHIDGLPGCAKAWNVLMR